MNQARRTRYFPLAVWLVSLVSIAAAISLAAPDRDAAECKATAYEKAASQAFDCEATPPCSADADSGAGIVEAVLCAMDGLCDFEDSACMDDDDDD